MTSGGPYGYPNDDGYGGGQPYPTSPYDDSGSYTPSFIERGFDEEQTETRGGRRAEPSGRAGRRAGPDTTGNRQVVGRQGRENTDPRGRRADTGRMTGAYEQQPGYGGQPGRGQTGGFPQQGGYPPDNAYDPRYARGGYEQGYDQRGYGQGGRGGYEQGGYEQGGYEQGGYEQGGYEQGGYEQEYEQAGYGRTYGQGGYGPAGGGTRGGGPGGGAGNGRGRQDAYDEGEYADYEEPIGKETKRRRGRSFVSFVLAILMIAVLGAVGLFGYKFYQSHFTTPDYSGMGTGTVNVTVHSGDSATAIATTLYNAGVIKSTKAFIAAAEADPGSQNIQVATYALHKQMSAQNALNMLLATKNGQPVYAVVWKVTIPETDISVDIYTALSKASGYPVSDFVAAAKDPLALGVDKAWFGEKRDDGRKNATVSEPGFKYPATIEGFLFPATYTFTPGESATQMLKDMVAKFNEVTGPKGLDLMAKAQQKHLVPYEVLIAASIAQHEASSAADMAGVAQVLWNRIHKSSDAGSNLGLDSEVNYWLRMIGKTSQESSQMTMSTLQSTSDPYTTHKASGYPPGPIGDPGEDALKGALNMDPTKASYFWFQTLSGSPKVVFAKTCPDFARQQGNSPTAVCG